MLHALDAKLNNVESGHAVLAHHVVQGLRRTTFLRKGYIVSKNPKRVLARVFSNRDGELGFAGLVRQCEAEGSLHVPPAIEPEVLHQSLKLAGAWLKRASATRRDCSDLITQFRPTAHASARKLPVCSDEVDSTTRNCSTFLS
jgi:hypothetical protein